MYLYRIEVFVCVAKHRHITRAADELHISQPSVSRHLKLLENEFGVVLHRQLSRGIELTAEGEQFLKRARSILAQYRELKYAFSKLHPGAENQSLRIGSSFAPSVSLLPPLLARFGQTNGDVGVVVVSGISEELEKQVLKRDIELAFITHPSNLEALVYEPCGRDEVVAFVSATHPLARKDKLAVDELAGVPLIVRTRTGERSTRTWERLRELANGEVSLNVALDCDSHRMLRHAVKEGKGLGFSYRNYLARDIASKKVKVLKIEGWEQDNSTYVVHAKERVLSAAAAVFLALIRGPNNNAKLVTESNHAPA